jgi:hypothetical protein
MLGEKLINAVQIVPNVMLRHFIEAIRKRPQFIDLGQERLMFFAQGFGDIAHGYSPFLSVPLRKFLGYRLADLRHLATQLRD